MVNNNQTHKPITCPDCYQCFGRIDKHLFQIHQLKPGSEKLKKTKTKNKTKQNKKKTIENCRKYTKKYQQVFPTLLNSNSSDESYNDSPNLCQKENKVKHKSKQNPNGKKKQPFSPNPSTPPPAVSPSNSNSLPCSA